MSFDLKIRGGDIVISRDGSLETVFDNAKLRQDIIKIMLTKIGENKFHPRYGSEVGSIRIGHVPDEELLEADLESSAEQAINNLISLQRSQSRRQFLTPGERLIALLDASVQRDEIDPRLYNIFLSVQTGTLTTVTESVTIRII
jgi:phage baseplate assembly protein W